jgi:flagellar biosynthesis component FlhA
MSVPAATAFGISPLETTPASRPSGTTTRVSILLEPAALPHRDPLFAETVRVNVTSAIAGLCANLGIPGIINVEVTHAPTDNGTNFLKLRVNGDRVRFPNELLTWLCAFLDNELPRFVENEDRLSNWLARHDRTSIASLISLTCVEALKRRCSVLFSEGAAMAYLQMLQQKGPEFPGLDLAYLQRTLKPVLNAWISIADAPTIGTALASFGNRPAAEVSQEIISALSADTVQIRMPLEYLREITTEAGESSLEALSWLRKGLFDELGLNFPRFHLVVDDSLRPRSFAFQVNDLLTMPRAALPKGTILVNSTPDDFTPLKQRLDDWARESAEETHGATKLPAGEIPCVLDPVTAWPNSLLPTSFAEHAVSIGLSTWDPLQYLVLCMGVALQAHAARLVTLKTVRLDLDRLAVDWPMTVAAALTEVTEYQLTWILQQLAREGVSIGNFLAILERLIDREYLATSQSAVTVLDDYPGQLFKDDKVQSPQGWLAFVRAGLRRTISDKIARHGTTLVLYVLEPALEDMVAAAGPLENMDETYVDHVLDAVRAEVRNVSARALVPAVVTTSEARLPLREILLQEFPRMAVIAHNEVSPELNIMPFARIGMSAKLQLHTS